MNAAQKTPSLFSILKDKPQLAWVGGIFLAIYLVYVIFFFRLTASAIISLLIAILVFLAVSLFWYYLAYRWAAPELTRTKFHQNLMLWLSSAMLGTAFSIWFIQNENIPTQVLQFLNRFLPYSILEGKPVAEYQAYFPLITWICITGVLTIVIRVFLAVLSWKQPGSTLLSKRIRMILLIAYAVSLFSVTACIFSTDFLEIGPGQPSIIFYGGTEDYVNYRIQNDRLNFWQDLQQYGGFLYGNDSFGEFQVYLSNTGFYGSILKLGQDLTNIPPDKFIKATRLLFGMILAGMLTAFSLAIKKKFGWMASIIFACFPVTIYWFIGPSTHLIWFFFILFVPFFLSIYLYPRVMAGKMSMHQFLWITFIGEAFVFLRGYSYTPGLILSAAIPVFYYDLYAKRTIKDILGHGIVICLAGSAAFCTVLSLHFIQLWFYTGSPVEAKNFLMDRALARGSSGDTNLETPWMIFQKWLNVRVFYLSKRIFAVFPQWQETFDRLNTFGNFHLLAFAGIIISSLLKFLQDKKILRNPYIRDEVDTLFHLSLTTLAAMLASWSWFPALGHMSHHYHMNGIMYMLPFGLTLFVLLALLIQTIFQWVMCRQN